MKKILLTIGLMAATSAVFAQGYINFSPSTMSVSTNGTTLSPIYTAALPQNAAGQTIGLTTPGQSPGNYYYELLIQHFTGTLPTDLNVVDGTWKDSGLADTNHLTVAGRIAPGPNPFNIGSLSGWNAFAYGGSTFPNGTNYIMLVGWSANLGSSWSQVSNNIANVELNNAGYFNNFAGNSFFGESTIGWENPSTSSGAGNILIGAAANAGGQPILLAGGLPLYELPVPEPATFALVGFGGLSLLLFRRRS
jgi:hypothetical protein